MIQIDRVRRRCPALLAATLLVAAALSATPALAQSSGSKVGVVNVEVLRGKLQEIKTFQIHMKQEQELMEASKQGHQEQIKRMSEKLQGLKPESDQYDEQLTAVQDKAADFTKEDQLRNAELVRQLNKETKALFLEIQQAVAEIAKQKGLDLVIVEPDPQLPVSVQNLDPQQLNAFISQRTVLYAAPGIDLTDQVAIAMDAAYARRGGK